MNVIDWSPSARKAIQNGKSRNARSRRIFSVSSWSHHSVFAHNLIIIQDERHGSVHFRLGHRMGPRPFLGGLDRCRLILLPPLSNIVGKRVIGVRRTQQSLDGKQDRSNLQGRGPVICSSNGRSVCAQNARSGGRTYFLTHPNRYAQDGRYWGGRSWSGNGSWAESWDSLPARKARDERFHLKVIAISDHFMTTSSYFQSFTFIGGLRRPVD